MLDWLFVVELIVSGAVALFTLILGIAKRSPSKVSISGLGLVALLAIWQLFTSIVLLSGGAVPVSGAVEFMFYVVVSLLVPLLAGFWATVERTSFSTFVMTIASVTYLIMVLREQQLWFGVI